MNDDDGHIDVFGKGEGAMGGFTLGLLPHSKLREMFYNYVDAGPK